MLQYGHVANVDEIIAGKKPATDLGVKAIDDKTFEVFIGAVGDDIRRLSPFFTIFFDGGFWYWGNGWMDKEFIEIRDRLAQGAPIN
jgi:hypothetical protein